MADNKEVSEAPREKLEGTPTTRPAVATRG